MDQQPDIGQIWEQFHKDRSDDSRNLLMKHYAYLVKYSAERLYSKLPDKVELDDLTSAGVFGLMDAIDAFDPERGVKFETYAVPRIRGAILDELRALDWVPRSTRAKSREIERALVKLENDLGRRLLPEKQRMRGGKTETVKESWELMELVVMNSIVSR